MGIRYHHGNKLGYVCTMYRVLGQLTQSVFLGSVVLTTYIYGEKPKIF